MDRGRPGTASGADTLRAVATVLLPLVARGTILRRPRMVALGERIDADRRLVRSLARLRARYGGGPVVLRLGVPGIAERRVVLPLSDEDVRQVLDASPDPYATTTPEKRAALGRFGPHGVLISDAADRPDRRRWNEAVLDTARPLHRLAEPMAAAAREEAAALLARAGEDGAVDWPAFTDAWYRLARRVTLGAGARDDTALTDLLARLRAQGNWSVLAPRRPALTARFLDRLRVHLDRAEPGSLAAVAAATPATARTTPAEQVPQWLFAFDAAGMSAFRALALLATHPRELAAVRAELAASRPGLQESHLHAATPHERGFPATHGSAPTAPPAELPTLRAAVLEAVRLWPTTPAILRETTAPTELGGVPLPAGALVLICAAFSHRDRERHGWADDFTPRLWTDPPPGGRGPAEPPGGRGTAEPPGGRGTAELFGGMGTAGPPRAALVPFSAGPAVCAGRNLVLFLTTTFLAALLEHRDVRVASAAPIRPGRPLPGTLDPFHLRMRLTVRS